MKQSKNISSQILKRDKELLRKSLENKTIPTKYLYDEKGSKLFEKICDTKEYYLTRLESKILSQYSEDLIKITNPKEFFELGSGSSRKTVVLLKEALRQKCRIKYISFDISEKALNMSFKQLKNISDNLQVDLIQGDFFKDFKNIDINNKNRIYLFLGSTLGNFENDLAVKFLFGISRAMKRNDYLLLGVDNIKDTNIIKSAYNDKAGITEQFNKNILSVLNEKYNLNFNKDNFEHNAIYNKKKNQIEMYLKSLTNQDLQFSDCDIIPIKRGDNFLTEISRKFSKNTLDELFVKSCLLIEKKFTDENDFFSLYLLKSNFKSK